MKIALLVMAAGYSSRYRQSGRGNKLAAIVRDKPLLQHTLDNVRATGLDFYVVTRPEDRQLHELMSEARVVYCTSGGLGESIAAGVKATADYDGWLITLADMPFIQPSSYRAVSEALRNSRLVRAQVNGIHGHPVGFQQSFYPELSALQGDKGARDLLRAESISFVNLADRGCVTDLDTAESVEQLNKSYFQE